MAREPSDGSVGIEVRQVTSAEDLETIFQIRDVVFVEEQALTPDARHDPDDRRSIHYLGYLQGQPVGTGRLTILGKEAQIAWVAVLKEHRGFGIGWAIMDAMIERAQEADTDYIILNAQVHAREFYRRLGFRSVGEEFTMAAIPHQVMIRSLNETGGGAARRFFNQYSRE
jgi:predicted GNAT family N-acyltransferase